MLGEPDHLLGNSTVVNLLLRRELTESMSCS